MFCDARIPRGRSSLNTAALVAINFALEFLPALLRDTDLVFEFGETFAQLPISSSKRNTSAEQFRFRYEDYPPPSDDRVNLTEQHVELMPRELRVEVLHVRSESV